MVQELLYMEGGIHMIVPSEYITVWQQYDCSYLPSALQKKISSYKHLPTTMYSVS